MWAEVILTILMFSCAFLSLVGIPGPLIISITILIYGIATEFTTVTPMVICIYIVLGLLGLVIDNIFSIYGAKKLGASKYGMLGAFIGIFLVIVLGPVGIVIGPLLGALTFEMIFANKIFDQALKAGLGAVIGLLTGIIAKTVLGIAMTAGFIILVF